MSANTRAVDRPGVRFRRRRGCALRAAALEALEARRLLATSTIVFPGSDGRLVYAPDAQGDVIPDFSMVGYKTGNVPLPNTTGGVSVPVKITLNPAAMDMTSTIQAAIDDVSNDAMDGNGFRGAVLLNAGNYPISGTLHITASGVVLEGVGDSSTTGTRLEATGTTTRFLIEVDGSGSRTTSGSTYTITDTYVPVGARSFHVSSTTSLAVGDSILVNRPSTANWIHDIGMDLLDNPWTAGSKDQNWERKVTAINGNLVTVDIPLTNSLDAQYGGGTFKHYSYSGRISQVGISDMYMYSDSTGAGDLAHATGSISMDKTIDGWMHNITSDGFSVNQIIIEGGSKFCTIDDAVVQNTTVSSQAPPAGISVNGVLNLVENVTEHGVYHAVALTSTVAGPNVIYNLFADGIGSDCGPHQRWSTGGLFDDVTIVGNDLQAFNRGNSGSGHGWAGANYVFWNCSARNLEIDNPPTAQNWAIGCIGNKGSDDGTFDSLGTNVQPFSLYQKQLWDRLHQNPTVVNQATATPNPRVSSTANLSVLGGYNLGESNLTYTWSVSSKPAGAANPTFGANGTNAAKNSVVTFSTPGTYALVVTISDAGGLIATSNVVVTDRATTQVNGTDGSNAIRIVRNGAFVDVFIDGPVAVLHQSYATSPLIVINALGGSDSVTVDYTGGDPVPANGLFIDGGGGVDGIVLAGASGADAVTLSVGNVTDNASSFGHADFEELDLQLGVGADTLTCSGNSSINLPAFAIDALGGGTLAMTPGSTLPDFTDLLVNGGATLDLGNTSQTIDTLSGNGTILTSASAAVSLTVGQQGGESVFTGSIKDGSGTISLVKNGPEKLTLAGANSYTGTSTINAGVIEAGATAAFIGLSGQVRFGGGTLHVTADGAAANIANKFTTSYSGATSASTATFDIDAGVTLTIGGNAASMQTNGGGSHGGTFTKTGLGTLRILSNNGQLDDPFKLNAGTVIVQSATGLGGADNSANHVDMKAGTTLILRQDANTNFLTPIDPQDSGGTVNVVIDRLTSGAAPTHSVNAIASVGSFTINLTAGANVTSGAATLAVGSITVAGGGTFAQSGNATLQLANNLTGIGGMSVTGGTFRLTPLTTRVIVTPMLAITGGGKLDVADNKLIVTNLNQLGSFNGSAYTGIAGLLASGRNGGAWNGNGILTSMPAAVTGLTTLAAARLGDVRGGLPDSQTVVFAGQTVAAGSTIVMYTYAGDSNFDGKVNVDDYGRINLNVGLGVSGWFNGDFNYDGKINVDDYGVIDFNLGAQGPPFPT